MTLAELGILSEIIGSVAVILTLIYLAVQIRQNTSQQKREENVAVQHGQNYVVAQLLDATLVRAYARTADGDTPASIGDRARTIIWVIQYLNHFQVVFDLYQDGSMDDERYELWEMFAVSIVASKGIRAWWDEESGKLGFMPKVRTIIDQKLNDAENPAIPLNKLWPIFSTESWSDVESTSIGRDT